MSSLRDFQVRRENTLNKLRIEIKNGRVDSKIIPLLEEINSIPYYYTTSSCAGRIVVLELPELGDKQNAVFLGRWHRMVSKQEVEESFKKTSKGYIWFLAQSPIFHVAAYTMEEAGRLLKAGYAAGFKHSGLKNTGDKIIVELTSTERIDAPIGRDGLILCSEEYLELLVENANLVIKRGEEKLMRLMREVSSIKDEYLGGGDGTP
ncbi:MAG TPA: hypothetical protein ENG62_01515 [Thermoplasmatales archaeon]|nr:hypothetical protein [Thermoplasmatales archaeon]